MYLVERTCTEIQENCPDGLKRTSSGPFSVHQNKSAYVLLGDPGAGKTTAFEQEAERQGACYVSARDLIIFEDRPEWHDKLLFIDGLDEIRTGSSDGRTPFDAIRARLDKLGRPRFRLSCREADWFGATDHERLKSVSPDGQVTILHLDPLTEADIVEILKHHPRVSNAKEFMQVAVQRGLNDLLTNPQILDMMVKAVAGGSWPETRKQTFELACRTIIEEHNPEHEDAARSRHVNIEAQLDAAGLLCAAQLIAGNVGYTLTGGRSSDGFPGLGELEYENFQLLYAVSRTKLFKSRPINENQIAPVHRLIAEYLAARYLTDRINKDGLPVGRILALITGEDAMVVSELRGLSAWLASLCKSHRRAIIERDPLGVILYGDIQEFTTQDKRYVLENLQRDPSLNHAIHSLHWTTPQFGGLATPDMEEEFRQILTAVDRSDKHQALADCVLDAMTHGDKLTNLDEVLLDIVRDTTRWPRIRRRALEAFQNNVEGSPDAGLRLKALMDEINSNVIADPDDGLMGFLLARLYPQTVSAEAVLDYLHTPKQQNLIGGYLMFWDYKLLGQSSDSDVKVLLDELVTRLDILQPVLDDHHFHDLTTRLLLRGIEVHGESIKLRCLYRWLGVALDRHGWLLPAEKAVSEGIRVWIETHPGTYKELIKIGLERCIGSEHFGSCMQTVSTRLFHAKFPEDFGRWCLVGMQTSSNDKIAQYLLQQAVITLCNRSGDAGLTLEAIQTIVEREPKHKAWLEDMLVCRIEPEEKAYIQKQRIRKAEEREKKQEWLRDLKSHQTELRKGLARPGLMHNLATAYFGHFIDSKGDTPVERLRNLLGPDEDLVQSVLEGLRRSLDRDDIPTATEIIGLNGKGETYFVSRPFQAGLEQLYQVSPSAIRQLSDNRIRQAVAFYLADGTGEDPEWYRLLLASRPDLVAETMTAYAKSAFRTNKQHIAGFYELAHVEAYNPVASLATLAMLKAFPARSSNQKLDSLSDLLIAALRFADKKALIELIDKKLGLGSMNVGQRVNWLAAGLVAGPEKYRQPLTDFVPVNEKRVHHLAGFLAGYYDQRVPLDDLPISALGVLVRLIGEFFAPCAWEKRSLVSPAMKAADLVERLIDHLGSLPQKEATEVLDDLAQNPDLVRWKTAIQHAKFQQSAVRREESFHHPDIRQVREVLNNKSPANAGDLAALTMDVLRELGDRIRNGNTDDYVQFWNKGSRKEPDTPRHEDICRDALLSDLQLRFEPLGIDARREGNYADNKRADIRVAYGGTNGFEVPIEIKKNNHRNLWRAIHDQLIAQYTREPNALGFGIYLVFWFGAHMTQPSPSGSPPRTAEELESRLRVTLSAEESRKISICVIDVAKPDLTAAS